MLKGNKGEWSELYVFAKLLAEGKLFQSDINFNSDKNNFYEVTKIYRKAGNSFLEFNREDEVVIYQVNNGGYEPIKKISYDYLNEQALLLFKGILAGIGNSFGIIEAENFIENAQIRKLTASVSSKSDLKLRIYDHRLAKEADLGFSIKSLIGQNPTLLNTGPGNNFIYEIKDELKISVEEFNASTYKAIGKTSKLTTRLLKLKNETGSNIAFKDVQSRQFWKNLKMVDGDLPQLLAEALLLRWIHQDATLSGVVKLLEENDPLNYYCDCGKGSKQKIYEYKLKRFLAECAMGMTSENPWNGVYDATGGVIIAKEDGDIVCFHIYDFNLFRDYLIKNTMFEQASTGEDEKKPGTNKTDKNSKKYYYGWLYEEDGKLFFKLNLQIRFI